MSKTTELVRYTAPGGEEICFPVARVKGNAPGPHVVITAGVHGCEYPGIVSAIRFFQELDPAVLRGEVTIVTVSSIKAFEDRTPFVGPVDGKNPNRCFPGTLDGTYTDALTYYLFHDFIQKGDYFMDLHGGDMVEALEPFSIYHCGGDPEVEQRSKEVAEYFGLPNIVSTMSGGSWDDSGTAYANAAIAGVPGAILEVGGIGQLDQESVDMHLTGLRNVLRHFGNLPQEGIKPDNLCFYQDFVWLRSPVKGIFYKEVNIGDRVKSGQSIGRVEDFFGTVLAQVTAPCDGALLFLTTSPAMADQGLILGLGVQ